MKNLKGKDGLSFKKSKEKNPAPDTLFDETLEKLKFTHPFVVSGLDKANKSRKKEIERLKKGIRFRGYEELLKHLTEMKRVYDKDKELSKISFLISRIKDDFEIALEAILSGYYRTAHEAMRDVMEVEFLLRDFFYQQENINFWLTLNEKERKRQFASIILRQRHAKRIGKEVQNMTEAADYKAHSMMLHVNPPIPPIEIIKNIPDSGFWEVFEHAKRVLFQVHDLCKKIAPKLDVPDEPKRGLNKIKKAYDATQEMQQIFLLLWRKEL